VDYFTKNTSEDEHLNEELYYSCKVKRVKEAVDTFNKMCQRGIWVNPDICNKILHLCINSNALIEGKQVYADMVEVGHKPYISLGNRLVDMFAKNLRFVDAHQVFYKKIV
jgi:pentatricopeptide repeat protein